MDFNWKTIITIIAGFYILYRITNSFSKVENDYNKDVEKILNEDKYKVKDQWS